MENKIREYYVAINEEITKVGYLYEETYRISGYCNRTLELESQMVGLHKAEQMLKEMFKDVFDVRAK